MDMKPEPYKHNAFWLEDRVTLTYEVNPTPNGNFPENNAIVNSMNRWVGRLNGAIADIGYSLSSIDIGEEKPLSKEQSPGSPKSSFLAEHVGDNPNDFPSGVYLFFPPPPRPGAPPLARPAKGLSFHTLIPNPGPPPGNIDQDCPDKPDLALVPRIVNRLNCHLPKQVTPDVQQVAVVAASPTWLCGATNGTTTGPISEGCPLSPPIPVPVDARCSSCTGLWPFTLPELSHDLQSMTGDGVTVFVLDTLPQPGQIKRAAEAAGESNVLLLDVLNNVAFNYPSMMDGLDIPSPSQAGAGKDIEGRAFGFRMPDHGLFVAGIIRDLAPNAKVECIRVLNDLCVGSTLTLVDALNEIHKRIIMGDLNGKPVVINLSLVIPDDMEAKNAGIDEAYLEMTRKDLLAVIQSLVDLGVIFVASAGNEGDQRYKPMSDKRPNALYPAAYAYHGLDEHAERMIPVGAVDKNGNATTYSCYPGDKGFATYGGDLPKAADIVHDADGMTRVKLIDAPIGLYTSLTYPALSIQDPEATYPAPNPHGWAYWVGTSFATPIVSAVAARALELRLRRPIVSMVDPPPPIVSAAATRTTNWTNLEPQAGSPQTDISPSAEGAVIWAVQCQPTRKKREDEEQENGAKGQVDVDIVSVIVEGPNQ